MENQGSFVSSTFLEHHGYIWLQSMKYRGSSLSYQLFRLEQWNCWWTPWEEHGIRYSWNIIFSPRTKGFKGCWWKDAAKSLHHLSERWHSLTWQPDLWHVVHGTKSSGCDLTWEVAQWPAASRILGDFAKKSQGLGFPSMISNVLPHVAVHPSDPWVLTGFGESCEGRRKRWSQLGRNQINQGQNSFEMDPPLPFPSISSRKWGN